LSETIIAGRRQDAETAAVGERIRQKIHTPSLVGTLRDRQRRSCSYRPLATRSPPHLKSFLTVEATELLVVHDDTLASQKDMEPSISEPPANKRQLTQTSPCRRIVRPAASIAHRRAVGSER
jgi:hypothetical protein